ncbi:MAG: PhzF family phenazine biosynthesis isomerase, partial [Bacteroidales bacterium]|nr:PhzF family phenazine biosynthesis isomerase [Bacteroidales bacterium]
MEQKIYYIDAFADQLFSGNPAAVCPLEQWPEDHLLQKIAMENNLAETAFYVPCKDGYQIRWFTPTVEVDLCGHATLAAAFVLFHFEGYAERTVHFFSS